MKKILILMLTVITVVGVTMGISAANTKVSYDDGNGNFGMLDNKGKMVFYVFSRKDREMTRFNKCNAVKEKFINYEFKYFPAEEFEEYTKMFNTLCFKHVSYKISSTGDVLKYHINSKEHLAARKYQ